MSYRILHTADVHLDRQFSRIGSDASLPERRRRGLRDALTSLGTIAQEQHCDLVSIGGDLYEDNYSTKGTAEFLKTTFASWAPLRVAISPGNHDSFYGSSLWATTDWPDNVHIFRETVFTQLALGDDLFLWGLAHPDDSWTGNPFSGCSLPATGTHIALFHGAETGSRPPDKAIHGPFRAEQIYDTGFSVALCGHYHARRIDQATGLIYPGTMEPLALDETGPRGPVVLEMTGGGRWRCDPLETNRWEALEIAYAVPEGSTFAQLGESVSQAINSGVGNAQGRPPRCLVRVSLNGPAPEIAGGGLHTRGRELEEMILEKTGVAEVSLVDQTRPSSALEELASEPTVRGEFVKEIQARMETASESERPILQSALEYGLAALAGEIPPL